MLDIELDFETTDGLSKAGSTVSATPKHYKSYERTTKLPFVVQLEYGITVEIQSGQKRSELDQSSRNIAKYRDDVEPAAAKEVRRQIKKKKKKKQ